MQTLLDYAKTAIGDNYPINKCSDERRLIVTVDAGEDVDNEWPEADEALEHIQELVGPAFSAEFTGDGNTGRDGDSTFDIRIEPIDGFRLANIHEAGNGFPEEGAFLGTSDGEVYRLVKYAGRTQTRQFAANWRLAIVEEDSCEEKQEFPAKLELLPELEKQG